MEQEIKAQLAKLGIRNVKEIVHNPSAEALRIAETSSDLEGYEKAQVTNTGALNVMTGVFTGRSPKDKFIVKDESTEEKVWWDTKAFPNDNHPLSTKAWNQLEDIAAQELSDKKLYVVDAYSGANEASRIKVRFVMEVAWQAHFVTNMFIRPTQEELKNFSEPDFVVLAASKAKVDNFKELGLHSETAVAFNLAKHMQIILNTWYGGEMKKGMFSVMNYLNPLRGIASMHCSANTDKDEKETAIFFGLSGTGKTTLSADPKRRLIGDDEHGWDDEGIFNYEGGCYAKVIRLSKEDEPDIWNAIRPHALLENVIVDKNGVVDYNDASATENTRVSYPIYHIENRVKPVSKGPHAKEIIFLTADAFGVLPPVSVLTEQQAEYYFLSGYTSKLAGTERGITEPVPTFSACFGAAFLTLHPFRYAEVLIRKARMAGSNFYLVNTGWNGTGERISIKDTRAIIDRILDHSILNAPCEMLPYFNLRFPTIVEGTHRNVLDPRGTYSDPDEWDKRAQKLTKAFRDNFKKFSNTSLQCEELEVYGPQSYRIDKVPDVLMSSPELNSSGFNCQY